MIRPRHRVRYINDGERPGGALEQAADTVKTVSPLRRLKTAVFDIILFRVVFYFKIVGRAKYGWIPA